MLKHGLVITASLLAAFPALSQDPDAQIRYNSGVQLLRDGFPERALPEILAAIKKDPKNSFFLKGLGITYSQLADRCKATDTDCRDGNLKKAVEAAQQSLALNPEYVDARNDLGTALLRLGKRTEGKAELARAFADPQCPTPEVTAWNLGQAFFEEKDYGEALTWFRAAQNRNKTLAAAYVGIADVLLATAQMEKAILQLEAGLTETSGNTALHVTLADVYLQAGRFQDARAAYEQVIKKDPLGPSGRHAVEKLRSFPR